MFVRLGLLVFLLAAMPALVLAELGDPKFDEFGNKIESQEDEVEVVEPEIVEPEIEPPPEKPVYPKMFDVMFGAGLGYATHIGDFYDGLDSGLLYFGDVRFAITPKTYIKFGYWSMNMLEESQTITDENGINLGTVDLSIDLHQYLFSVGFLAAPSETSNLRVYSEFGLGYGDHVVSASAGSVSASESEGRLMLLLQFGLLMPIQKDLLGLEMSVTGMAKSFGGDVGEPSGIIFGAQVGLVLQFGGGQVEVESPASSGP